MERLIITPKTKIYDLLESYPELEDTLIAAAPEFSKLKNPVLRKTIARITSISQAAIIGGLNVEELVNKLREQAGQGSISQIEETGGSYNTVCPGWFSQKAVAKVIDINEMLNKGEQSVHEVMAAIKQLKENEMLELITSFVPAPLLDKSLSLEYSHWIDKKAEKEYRVYFTKQA